MLVTGLQQLRSLSSLTHLSFDAVARPPLPGRLLQLSFEDAHTYPGCAVKIANSMRWLLSFYGHPNMLSLLQQQSRCIRMTSPRRIMQRSTQAAGCMRLSA